MNEQTENTASAEVQVEPIKSPIKQSPLATTEDGLLVGSTLEEQFRLATAYCRSGIVPKGLATPEKVLVAMQFARELGLPPITSMRNIAVINGQAALWGDIPLALVRRSGLLEGISEALIDENGIEINARDFASTKIHGAICIVKRKNEQPRTFVFSVPDAERAGLWGKSGPWSTYPKRMLQMRARGQALKDVFPDVLMGAAIAEYDYHTETGEELAAPADKLREKFNGAS